MAPHCCPAGFHAHTVITSGLLLIVFLARAVSSQNGGGYMPDCSEEEGVSGEDTQGVNLKPASEIFPVCKEDGLAEVTFAARDRSRIPWRGWGTALAWFGNYIGGLPGDQLDSILDLLFSPSKGLGLNIVRFNIGGGHNSTYSPQFDVDRTRLAKWRALPGYRSAISADYDWDSDRDQRNSLLGARSRGADTFIAASFSPPWWMTISGDVAGSEDGHCNLRDDMYQEYADYLADVITEYSTNPEWNITFQQLEAVNEPTDGAWRKGGGQEGCTFRRPCLSRFLPMVAETLENKSLSTELVGTDSWAVSAASLLRGLEPEVVSRLSRIHVHGYLAFNCSHPWDATETAYGNVRREAERWRKEVWVSEWTYMKHVGKGIDLALIMARNIVESVNLMGAVAWVFWQPVTGNLVKIKWDPHRNDTWPHGTTTDFWILKHFTVFAPVGSYSVMLNSSSGCEHCITAFYSPADSSLAVFVVYQRTRPREIKVSLESFNATEGTEAVTCTVYRTSETEEFADVETRIFGPDSDGWQEVFVTAQGRSLTTFVFKDVFPVEEPQWPESPAPAPDVVEFPTPSPSEGLFEGPAGEDDFLATWMLPRIEPVPGISPAAPETL